MGRRHYRYATDEQIREYLSSICPTGKFVTSGELYGHVDERGRRSICMDDDDERAQAIINYLKRQGAIEDLA
jgi:hypothetical protein